MTVSGAVRHFDLAFERSGHGRSFLATQFVRYPLHICRGLYLDAQDDDACSLTLQSTSGGLFEGDCINGRVRAGRATRTTVCTSASTIVHTMNDHDAAQSVEIEADANAVLAYLPQPLIMFPQSALRSTVSVQVHPTATVVFCESFLAHDPKAEQRPFELLDLRVAVRSVDGDLLVRDRQLLSGVAWQAQTVGVAGPYTVHANVWLLRRGLPSEVLARLREVLDTTAAYAGASLLPNEAGLQVRMLCADGIALQKSLESVLAEIRRLESPSKISQALSSALA